MEAFRKKFKTNEYLIAKKGNWIISLRPKQVTLGSLVLSLDRKCPHLGELTKKEGKELSEAFHFIETLLASTFKPDKINYLALMMVDEQVHFHIIPRYAEPITFKEKKYTDQDWPKAVNIAYTIQQDIAYDLLQKFKEV